MPGFEEPVREHMARPVRTVREDERLSVAARRIAELEISGLAVLDARGDPVGVITRGDLLSAGRSHVGEREHVVNLPDAYVREHMHRGIDAVAPDLPLRRAAKQMVDAHEHRLFVAEDGQLVGLVGTREVMRAVVRQEVRVPIADIMTSSVVTVSVDDPLALAVDRLAAAHRWALIVVIDRAWPLGSFSQVEALAARDAPSMQRVEHWMRPGALCLPAEMPAHRAARAALALGAPPIVAVSETGIRGIVTATDFARLVSDAP